MMSNAVTMISGIQILLFILISVFMVKIDSHVILKANEKYALLQATGSLMSDNLHRLSFPIKWNFYL